MRDQIPAIIRAESRTPAVVVLDGDDYEEALVAKVYEELDELLEAAIEEKREEFADVIEVLRAYASHLGIDWEDVEQTRSDKADVRGGFSERIWLL